MGVGLPLAPILPTILLSTTTTMELTPITMEPIKEFTDEQIELIEKIEASIPEDAWPLVYKAIAEQITEQASVNMLISMFDYVLENFFKENPEETIPLFLQFFDEDYVIKAIDNMKLDIVTPINTEV